MSQLHPQSAAIHRRSNHQNLLRSPDAQHAAAECLKGGTDINSGNTYASQIAPGVLSGVISEDTARAALHNAYGFRMRLGLFDANNANDPNRAIPVASIGNSEHQQASLDAARASMVLLKNDEKRGLPFRVGKRLVVIGTDVDSWYSVMEPSNYNADNICPRIQQNHMAGNSRLLGVDFSGGINTDCLTTIWRELNKSNAAAGGTSTIFAKQCKDQLDGLGCSSFEQWNATSTAKAVALAQTADNLIVVISNAEDEGGEGMDRKSIALAPDQAALAKAVFGAIADRPEVQATLMMINGGVIAFDDELREAVPSILEIFMPGVMGPQAVAETIWGYNVPGGKLPFTMYYSNYTDGCDIDDMSMQACGGRTYRYFDGPTVRDSSPYALIPTFFPAPAQGSCPPLSSIPSPLDVCSVKKNKNVPAADLSFWPRSVWLAQWLFLFELVTGHNTSTNGFP
eukprot:SAG31_NODE_1170_length_9560_cov_3.537031_3_plen_455_part_00